MFRKLPCFERACADVFSFRPPPRRGFRTPSRPAMLKPASYSMTSLMQLNCAAFTVRPPEPSVSVCF